MGFNITPIRKGNKGTYISTNKCLSFLLLHSVYYLRMRSRFRRRRFRRSFTRVPVHKRPRRRATNRRMGVAKPGYVRNYRRAAIAGKSRRFTPRKMASAVPSKRTITTQSVANMTNSASTSDRSMIFMPMGHMFQSTTDANGRFDSQSTFRGEKIYLTGIKLNIFLNSTQNEDYYVRILGFWCTDDMDLFTAMVGTADPTANWVNTASVANATSVKNNNTLRFLDVPYGSAGYPDFQNITARANPLYPGKLLYDKVHKLTLTGYNTIAATTNPTKYIQLWFPFNKLFEWNSYGFGDDYAQAINPLQATPNFGKYGQPVFVMYYLNGEALSGNTQRKFDFSMESRIYFRDI